jgi:hypothetical protein
MHEIFEKIAIYAILKQEKLDKFVRGKICKYSINDGSMYIGESRFSIEVLGSHSTHGKTWLWSWANKKSRLPDEVVQMAIDLYEFGERRKLPIFINGCIEDSGEFGSEEIILSCIGLLGSRVLGVCKFSYSDGYVALAVKPGPSIGIREIYAVEIVNAIYHCIEKYNVNHRHAILSFFKAAKIDAVEVGRSIQVNEDGMEIEFDNREMVKAIKVGDVKRYWRVI